jgi:hypothetical protein
VVVIVAVAVVLVVGDDDELPVLVQLQRRALQLRARRYDCDVLLLVEGDVGIYRVPQEMRPHLLVLFVVRIYGIGMGIGGG